MFELVELKNQLPIIATKIYAEIASIGMRLVMRHIYSVDPATIDAPVEICELSQHELFITRCLFRPALFIGRKAKQWLILQRRDRYADYLRERILH